VVVTDKETKRQVADTTNRPEVFEKAGAIIAACSNSDEVMRCGQAIGPIDVAIALEHIALQATELGLATCWIGSFYTDKVRAILDIPADVAIIELMAIGYPADEQKKPQREPMEKIICYEKWKF
jgi:nitroreductase